MRQTRTYKNHRCYDAGHLANREFGHDEAFMSLNHPPSGIRVSTGRVSFLEQTIDV
jgi:hypothetical protein